MVAHDFTDGSYDSARTSLFVLPVVFSWVDATPTDYRWMVPEEGDFFLDRHWLWSGTGFRDNRYQQIHAFDLEAEVGLLVFVETGFSIGELVDFLLGIVTIDIAGDDGRIDP
jgi:hypothetical protein